MICTQQYRNDSIRLAWAFISLGRTAVSLIYFWGKCIFYCSYFLSLNVDGNDANRGYTFDMNFDTRDPKKMIKLEHNCIEGE